MTQPTYTTPTSTILRDDALHEAQATLREAAHGTLPDGRLDSLDADIAVHVGIEQGQVVLHFGTPLAWIGMTPAHAMEVAVSLMKHARRAGLTGPIVWRLGEKP